MDFLKVANNIEKRQYSTSQIAAILEDIYFKGVSDTHQQYNENPQLYACETPEFIVVESKINFDKTI